MINALIPKSKRGGKRPGAGRPAGPPRKQLCVNLIPRVFHTIKGLALASKKSAGQIIEDLFPH